MASIAIIGQILMDEQKVKAQTTATGTANVWKPPEDFIVHLGGDGNFKRFHFTDGRETVTFTAEELMAALLEANR